MNINKLSNNRFFNNNNLRRLVNFLQPMGNAINFAQLGRSLYNTMTRRKQRFPRRFGNKGIEINRAVGGFKSLRFNGPKISQVINFYAKIVFDPNDGDFYKFDYDNQKTDNFDLKAQLNDSDEFLLMRKQAIQYNVRQIAISFNYNRVPQAKEKWSKLILTPETDKIERTEFTYNANAMAWDMTTNGTKNYNFRINRTNTDDEDAGWIIGQAQFNGILKIWIDGQGSNYVPPQQYTFDKEMELGEVKISVQIEYYHKDITDANAKIERTRFKTKELLEPLIKQKLEENKQEKELKMLPKAKSFTNLI